jgi:hypothetical protein
MIVLNVRVPTVDKSNDSTEMSRKEVEQLFYYFPRHHTEFC